MTTITMRIWDGDDQTINAEASLDNPNAINEPPTSALIIGSYLGANMDRVARDAIQWFEAMQKQPEPEAAIKAPKLILPDDISGAPV
jgi:hypothetical protein